MNNIKKSVMDAYEIIDKEKIEEHISFIRINPIDITLTLKDVFRSLSNLSWIDNFDAEYIKSSFETRAEATVRHIANNIIKNTDDSITTDSGEYVVSELARKSIVNELDYSDIPLGELIKEQKSGNPGFDFYSENKNKVLLYGEAKYNSSRNAYGIAFEQIVRFENEKRDHADLVDIDKFCSKIALNNVILGRKGFIAAFASKKTSTLNLIKNIKENQHYKILSRFEELICIAVNI